MNNLFMTRRLRRLGGFAALLALSPLTLTSTAWAQDAKDTTKDSAKPADKIATTDVTTPTTWTIKYAKGDTAKYRSHLGAIGKVDSMPFEVAIVIVADCVIKEASDAEYTVVETTTSETTIMNDQAQPDSETPRIVTLTMTRNGVVKKVAVENEPRGWPPGVRTVLTLLANAPAPAKPVKSGDTWKTELDNKFVEDKKFTMTSTLVGMEKVAGIDSLRVKIEATVPPKADAKDDDAIKIKGYYDVDPKTGRRVRVVFNIENFKDETSANIITGTLTYKSSLIVPSVNDKDDATDKKTDK